jgi:small nuclear ribonucleoprotein D3
MNVAMKEVTCTARDGKQSRLESIYIRGSMIR